MKEIQVGPGVGVIKKRINQKSCTYRLRDDDPSSKIVLTVTEANCEPAASKDPLQSYFVVSCSCSITCLYSDFFRFCVK